jgi:V8-like Glu-specific endopeptidase
MEGASRMVNSSGVSRKCLVLTLGSLFLVSTFVVAWAAPGSGSGRPYAEAQMRVATEGMTAAEYLQQQATISRWLAGELPAAALEAMARIPVTLEEIEGVDRAPRASFPLKVGLVKPVIPAIGVAGLTRGSTAGQARRGAPALAHPTHDGGFVWAAVVSSEAAGSIRLHVESLSLPANAALYFYSRSGEAFGPYTDDGPNRTGEFWTESVYGVEGILQVRLASPVTEADLDAVSFRIVEAGIVTPKFAGPPPRRIETPPPGPGGDTWPCADNISCLVDANCVNGTPADVAEDAVAKMEWIQGAFIYTCSGGLIADNNPTQGNFFLTANHCVSKNNTAQNVQFYWKFQTSGCNGTCPTNSTAVKTTGSTVSKSGRKGDFSLLHLNTNPPAGSVFLGWTTAPVANSNGVDLFRISNPNFGPQVFSQHDVSTSAVTCSGWPRGERIYSKDITGAIDGGSSGSPVVNSSSQIVGQLSGLCGFNVGDACDAASNATVDGAFAFYYSQVQPILNP